MPLIKWNDVDEDVLKERCDSSPRSVSPVSVKESDGGKQTPDKSSSLSEDGEEPNDKTHQSKPQPNGKRSASPPISKKKKIKKAEDQEGKDNLPGPLISTGIEQVLAEIPDFTEPNEPSADGEKARPFRTRWTFQQKFALCLMIAQAGKQNANWADIARQINERNPPGAKTKTESRCRQAFIETHVPKFIVANGFGRHDKNTEVGWPDTESKGQAGWTSEQIKTLWREVMGIGARKVDWRKVVGYINTKGPARKESDCPKNWRDTYAHRFGLPRSRKPKSTAESPASERKKKRQEMASQ